MVSRMVANWRRGGVPWRGGRGFINPHPFLREEAGVRSMANLGSYARGEWLIGASKLLMPLFSRPIRVDVAMSSS